MNNPSPLIPQGSIQEQKNRSRTRMRAAFVFIASIHIVGLVTLLTMQGCKREQPPETPAEVTTETPAFQPPTVPAEDTNVVYIPPAMDTNQATATQMPPAAAPTEYTILKGDTFSSIGKAHGISTRAIQEANPGLDPNKLQVGKKIVLPVPSVSPTPAVEPGMAPTGSGEVYSVVSGDTLTSIAKKYGITVNQLRLANSLTTDRIKVGQKLKIPAKAPGAMNAPKATPVAMVPASPVTTTHVSN